MASGRPLRLVVFHSHYRAGGVRRVIELGMEGFAAAGCGALGEVLFAGGEPPDAAWLEGMRERLRPARVRAFADPALGYVSEMPETLGLKRRAARAMERLFAEKADAVWAHNLGLGRNAAAAAALASACEARGIPLVAHHHDWWFDGRWEHFGAMARTGARGLAGAARALLAGGRRTTHLALVPEEARGLAAGFGPRSGWLANPLPRPLPGPARPERATRRWFKELTGGQEAPVWVMPCRLLRRKNLGEGLLLARWLRPGAWVVTTAGAGSAADRAYGRTLGEAARIGGWPLALGALAADPRAPDIREAIAAAECFLSTSVKEGFGYALAEAASAGKPVVARKIPGRFDALERIGFRFPHAYGETLIPPDLFRWRAERAAQERLFARWKSGLPPGLARRVRPPRIVEEQAPGPVPFSRLTLAGQIEVLGRDPRSSLAACEGLNPHLAEWREQIARGGLAAPGWPEEADACGPGAFAKGLLRVFRRRQAPANWRPSPERAQAALIASKLVPEEWFPMLAG